MNILTLLKNDHKKVKGILEELGRTTSRAVKKRKSLFEVLQKELKIHEEIEESIFYPRFKSNKKTKDIILEAYEEHHVVDLILEELAQLEPSHEQWLPKLIVLKENLTHHIKEEEKVLFPKVMQIVNKEVLEEMGEEMSEQKEILSKGIDI